MKIDIFTIPIESLALSGAEIAPQYRGYIEAERFDPDECWHLCNWICWAKKKPENLHADIETYGAGIIFKAEGDSQYHMALALGWKTYNSMADIVNEVRENGVYALISAGI